MDRVRRTAARRQSRQWAYMADRSRPRKDDVKTNTDRPLCCSIIHGRNIEYIRIATWCQMSWQRERVTCFGRSMYNHRIQSRRIIDRSISSIPTLLLSRRSIGWRSYAVRYGYWVIECRVRSRIRQAWCCDSVCWSISVLLHFFAVGRHGNDQRTFVSIYGGIFGVLKIRKVSLTAVYSLLYDVIV